MVTVSKTAITGDGGPRLGRKASPGKNEAPLVVENISDAQREKFCPP